MYEVDDVNGFSDMCGLTESFSGLAGIEYRNKGYQYGVTYA